MVVGHPTDAEAGDGGCLACAKHRGEPGVAGRAIYQDDLVYVSHVMPRDGATLAYLGYVIVETQRHAPGLADLSAAEAQAVGAWVVRIVISMSTCWRDIQVPRTSTGAYA